MPLPFMVWRVSHVSLWGVPCTPLSLKTLLSWGLVAWIQKKIYLGHLFAMGFDWQPCSLLLSMGGILALFHLCPLAAPTYLLWGILVGGLWIQKRIYRDGACHMGFGRRPHALLLPMRGALVLHHHHPLAAPLFHCLDLLMGGLVWCMPGWVKK
jgi:hypothetical protein